MREIGIAKELMDLLEGFEDVFVHVSSFPDMDEMPNGLWKVSLGHSGQEGDKMEIEGGRTECAYKRECEWYLLECLYISEKGQEADQMTQIAPRQAHNPCPHLVRKRFNLIHLE